MSDTITKQLKVILGVDNLTGFRSGLTQAEASVSTLANKIGSQLKTAVIGAVSAYMGGQGLRAAFDWTIASAMKQDVIMRRLQTAVEMAGIQYKNAKPRIDAFLESMKATTQFEDEEMAAAFQQILQLTQNIDTAFRGAKLAADMAAAGFGNLEGNTILAARAIRDGHVLIGRMNFTLAELEKRYSGSAATNVQTFAGNIHQMTKEFDDLGKSIGLLVLPALNDFAKQVGAPDKMRPISAQLNDIAELMKSLDLSPWEKLLMIVGLQYPKAFALASKAAEEFKQKQLDAANAAALAEAGRAHLTLTESAQVRQADAEKQIELAVKVAEARYGANLISFNQLERLYERELQIFKDNAEKKAEIEKKLADERLKIQIDYEKRWAAVSSPFAPNMQPRGRSTPEPKLIELQPMNKFPNTIGLFQQIWNEVRLAIGNGGSVIVGAFNEMISRFGDAVSNSFADIFYSVSSMISELKKKEPDMSSVRASLMSIGSSFISIISDSLNSFAHYHDRYNESLKSFREEVQRNIDAINELTFAQKQQRIEELQFWKDWAEGAIAQGYGSWTAQEGPYKGMTANDIRDLVNQELGALLMDEETLNGLRGVSDFGGAMSFITGNAATMGYQQAAQAIQYFVRMLGLSDEQALSLWQQLQQTLGQNITGDDWMQLNQTIKDLNDSIAEGDSGRSIAPGLNDPGSQIMRSITTITENQANIMVGVLNSIQAILQQMLDIMRGSIPSGYGLAGVNIGPIYINADSQTSGRRVANELTAQLRASGFKAY